MKRVPNGLRKDSSAGANPLSCDFSFETLRFSAPGLPLFICIRIKSQHWRMGGWMGAQQPDNDRHTHCDSDIYKSTQAPIWKSGEEWFADEYKRGSNGIRFDSKLVGDDDDFVSKTRSAKFLLTKLKYIQYICQISRSILSPTTSHKITASRCFRLVVRCNRIHRNHKKKAQD